jgi:hypothetical protein
VPTILDFDMDELGFNLRRPPIDTDAEQLIRDEQDEVIRRADAFQVAVRLSRDGVPGLCKGTRSISRRAYEAPRTTCRFPPPPAEAAFSLP